jgi:hypothetical protein
LCFLAHPAVSDGVGARAAMSFERLFRYDYPTYEWEHRRWADDEDYEWSEEDWYLMLYPGVLVCLMLLMTVGHAASAGWLERRRRAEVDELLEAGRQPWTAEMTCSECVLCLDEFDDGSKCLKLACGHHFHAECIGKWLVDGQVGRTRTCPSCRQKCLLGDFDRPDDDAYDNTDQAAIDFLQTMSRAACPSALQRCVPCQLTADGSFLV